MKIMAGIYAAATPVVIRLGNPLTHTERVLDLISLLSQMCDEKFNEMRRRYIYEEKTYPLLPTNTISIAEWMAVRSFFDQKLAPACFDYTRMEHT
jgi:hypothetical protein